MDDFTHVLEWFSGTEYYECRAGDCSFVKTTEELQAAGYTPIKDRILFVKESDFDE